MDEKEPAYKKRGIPKSITIKGIELYYKDPPLKDNTYVYRCRKKDFNYHIKIRKENLEKINQKSTEINYVQINKHTGHGEAGEEENVKLEKVDVKEIRTEKETKELAINLIKSNISESLEFHIKNFNHNRIFWKKSKIRKMLYELREQKISKRRTIFEFHKFD